MLKVPHPAFRFCWYLAELSGVLHERLYFMVENLCQIQAQLISIVRI